MIKKGDEPQTMRTLKDTRKRIAKLEDEKTELLVELKKLKEKIEEKTDSLEEEVEQLREDVKSFRKLLESN